MAINPAFFGGGQDPYHKDFFTNRSYTPDFLDQMAASPGAQRQLYLSLLRDARFGEGARMGNAYTSYLDNANNLLSSMFGLSGTLGIGQNEGGSSETMADMFNSMFKVPGPTNQGAGSTLTQRRGDILSQLATGGERARVAEGDVAGASANARAQGAIGLGQQIGDMLAGQLPAEAIAALYSGGNLERIYNDWQKRTFGQENVGTFAQELFGRGYMPGASKRTNETQFTPYNQMNAGAYQGTNL